MARTPQLMGIKRAAEFLGVDTATLRKWEKDAKGPPRRKIGSRYYYAVDGLKEWLKDWESEVTPAKPKRIDTAICPATVSLGR